jgi:hypothetical protein
MKGLRLITAGAAALVIGSALPAVASAADYCVLPNTSCGANNVDDLQVALDKAVAKDDADRILLGVGTYVGSLTGFGYNSQTAPVEIVGAGRDSTVLTAPTGAIDQVFDLYGPSGTSIHDLTFRIPKQATPNFFALDTRSDVSRVDVVENPDQNGYRHGVRLTAPSTLEDSTVTLAEAATTGVVMRNALLAPSPSVIRRSAIHAGWGVDSRGGGRVERSTVIASGEGVYAYGGVTDIANSVIRFPSAAGHGVYADAASPGTTVNMDGATVVGPADGKGAAILATTFNNPTMNARINLTNSILRALHAMHTSAAGQGLAEIDASFSDYDPSGNQSLGGSVSESSVQNAGDARFVNPDAGDYRLLPGSPMVDAGDPATAQSTDLDGNPLVADGNGDGAARRDLGAFELQAPPPPAPAPDTSAPVISRFRASRERLRYALSESARVTVRIQRRIRGHRARYRTLGKLAKPARQGANRLKLSRRIRARDIRPGRYRAVIVAIDAAGNRSAPKVAAFRVRRR